MTEHVDRSKVRRIAEMHGEDEAETSELEQLLREARAYLGSFAWCDAIEEEYFGIGIVPIVGVFLFRIRPKGDGDDWLWVIVGDLPSAYLVTDRASSPALALEVYCELMDDWIQAVRRNEDMRNVFPISATPSADNADLLAKRIVFLRKKIIPFM